jgi:phytanoyl-CoA hydroxylase
MFSTDSSLVNPVPWREAGLMTQTQHGALRATPGGQAGDDLADRYARDGYAIVPRAFTTAEVAELRAEALRICRGT